MKRSALLKLHFLKKEWLFVMLIFRSALGLPEISDNLILIPCMLSLERRQNQITNNRP